MNSRSSPATLPKRPAFQSALACSILSCEDETKFQKMKRGTVHHRAAQQQQPSAAWPGEEGETVAGAEQQHPSGLEIGTGDLHRALDDVGAAFLVRSGSGSAAPGDSATRRRTAATGYPRANAGPSRRPRSGAAECRARSGSAGRQPGGGRRPPASPPMSWAGRPRTGCRTACCCGPQCGVGALRVGDATSGRHPVDIARVDRKLRPKGVSMHDRTVEQIGDSGQADVRMRPNVKATTGEKFSGSHLIEEDERPDHLLFRGGQRAAHLEAADIVGTRDDHRFDAGRPGYIVARRLVHGAALSSSDREESIDRIAPHVRTAPWPHGCVG